MRWPEDFFWEEWLFIGGVVLVLALLFIAGIVTRGWVTITGASILLAGGAVALAVALSRTRLPAYNDPGMEELVFLISVLGVFGLVFGAGVAVGTWLYQ
ncbi:MAG TPA: hypothetical protein VKO45_00990 [Methanomicrobiales archaeon]|nr:hypothetical protein [Methanomicrobiales archaeon]